MSVSASSSLTSYGSLSVEIYSTKPKEGVPGATDDVLFAAAPIDLRANPDRSMEAYVTAVVDSSRYFALRCEDAKSGRHVYVGVGFRERNNATDFKSTLQDYVSGIRREKEAEKMRSEAAAAVGDEGGSVLDVAPVQDLSLKEGEKISINIGGRAAGGGKPKKEKKKAAAGGGGGFLLKPPPPSADDSKIRIPLPVPGNTTTATPQNTPAKEDGGADEEDWGDFEEA